MTRASCPLQSKVSSFASQLESTNQKLETKCSGIRKEMGKALTEQKQQLLAQSEAMAKRMDTVAAKVCCLSGCTLSMMQCVHDHDTKWRCSMS